MKNMINDIVLPSESNEIAVLEEEENVESSKYIGKANHRRANELTTVFVSGAGFLADAYDLFVINVVVDIMNKVEYHQKLTTFIKSSIKAISLIGAIIGQLSFGVLADMIGRRKVFILTCVLVIIGALCSACVQNINNIGIYYQLIICRFFLGVGVGGEYPLSASVTSEHSVPENQLTNLSLVFSMQGFGTLLCSVVLVMVTYTINNYEIQWRLALAFGALPMILAFYFRWKMEESAVWQQSLKAQSELQDIVNQSIVNEQQDTENQTTELLPNFKLKYSSFCNSILKFKSNVEVTLISIFTTLKENRYRLLGTAGCWFILDIVFYANGLFSGQVISTMGFAKTIKGEALATLILQTLSLPGYLATIVFLPRIGLRPLQLLGFSMTGIMFILLSVLQKSLLQFPILYVIIYGLTFFFQNFGPNSTTYIIPSLLYTSHQKATCHGLSAASGKVGAILGAATFLTFEGWFCYHHICNDEIDLEKHQKGMTLTFHLCGLLALLGFIWTLFFIPKDHYYYCGVNTSNNNNNISHQKESNQLTSFNSEFSSRGIISSDYMLVEDDNNNSTDKQERKI